MIGTTTAPSFTTTAQVSDAASYSVVARLGAIPSQPVFIGVTVQDTPVCSSLTAAPQVVEQGGALSLAVSCTQTPTSYEWRLNGNLITTTTAPTLAATAPMTPGNAAYSVIAKQGAVSLSSLSLVVNVLNVRPDCTSVTVAPLLANSGAPITLSAVCTNAPTLYEWRSGTLASSTLISTTIVPTLATTAPAITGPATQGYVLIAYHGSIASTPVVATLAINAPPNISLTAPAASAVFTAPAAITLSANATDSDGTIAMVEFYNGTTLIGSDTTAPFGYTWSGVAAGSYTLTAKAYDNLAAVTTSMPINITINQANQTITGFTPASPITYAPNASIALTAMGGASGNPITFTSLTPAVCTVSANTATLLSAGTCTLAADQAGNANYQA
ncbi:MAG: hypothetical protein JNM52_03070, partial [Betaproteobacteria bacterium]|nr:hypothetical protein [Betaproteobacteria bacterium]